VAIEMMEILVQLSPENFEKVKLIVSLLSVRPGEPQRNQELVFDLLRKGD
jgi:hypothetical protein